MKNLFNSIKTRMIFYVLILIFIIQLTIIILNYFQIKQILLSDLKEESLNIVAPMNIALKEKLLSFKNISDQKDFLDIYVELKGKILFSLWEKNINNLTNVYFISNKKVFPKVELNLENDIFEFSNSKKKNILILESKNNIYVILPFIINKNKLGSFLLIYSNKFIKKMQDISLKRSCCVFLIFIILAIIGTLYISSKITKPINDLIKDSKKITEGKLNYPIKLLSYNELEVLAENFNIMRDSIYNKILNLNEEIDNRKIVEKTLKDNKKNISIILNSISDGVIAVDLNNIIIRVNPAVEMITGWSFNEIPGKRYSEIFRIIDIKTKISSDPIKEILKKNKNIEFDKNVFLITKDNIYKRIAYNVSLLKDGDNKIVGAVIVFKDITEHLKMEEKIIQNQKMDSIGHLAGGVAHDFNNMLGGILSSAELLLYNLKNDENNKESIEMIINSAKKAANLTKKLLSFSRQTKISYLVFNINEAIDQAIDLFKHNINKEIKIIKELNAEFKYINGDIAQIENVFLNLLLNAKDAISGKGVIEITTKNKEICKNDMLNIESGNYIVISIKDNGVGIKKDIIKKIFDPFFTTKEVNKGTGLGLSVVYGIIEQHQGKIIVYSECGHGTEFKIYIPIKNDVNNIKQKYKNKLSFGSGKILLIDDNPIIRITTKRILNKIGYNVLLAENGNDGIKIYNKEYKNIDVVILDYIMPEKNGKEVLDEIKKDHPDVKVVVVSGFTDNSFEDIIDNKNIRFISKPFNIKVLSEILKEMIK